MKKEKGAKGNERTMRSGETYLAQYNKVSEDLY
jgi:hypothetical protein